MNRNDHTQSYAYIASFFSLFDRFFICFCLRATNDDGVTGARCAHATRLIANPLLACYVYMRAHNSHLFPP